MKNSKPIVAANWKMNKTPNEAREFVQEFLRSVSSDEQNQFIIFPPAIDLMAVSDLLSGTKVGWGAQNIYFQDSGAFTGENSPAVVKTIGASHVLVGHSERRQLFFENDEMIAEKVRAAQKHQLIPVLCVGETLRQRESEQTEAVLIEQLKGGLLLVNPDLPILIAYEPVWAIGTGKVATPQQADQAHFCIREYLSKNFAGTRLEKAPILYGGSVKPENAKELFAQPQVDGFLVGGASLEPKSFVSIFRHCLTE